MERISRVAGHVGAVLAKLPRAVAALPEVLWFTFADAALPLALGAATLGSGLAVAGLGVAGVMEAIQGVHHRDAAECLTGVGEVTRGVLVGGAALQASHVAFSATAAAVTGGVGLLNAAVGLGCGAVKVRRGLVSGEASEKIEGSLLLGMGTCSLVAAAGTLAGPAFSSLLAPAVATQAVLGTARFCYLHREGIKDGFHRFTARVHETWERFQEIFREEPS